MSDWSGRRVRNLVNATLSLKGRTCHLCQLPGADSADHDPPRSVLLAMGVPDPDALVYLHPAHILCNIRRKARPITGELRAELRAARIVDVGPSIDAGQLSPRFLRAAGRPGSQAFPPSPNPEKNATNRARS